jgi:hypothetical protein
MKEPEVGNRAVASPSTVNIANATQQMSVYPMMIPGPPPVLRAYTFVRNIFPLVTIITYSSNTDENTTADIPSQSNHLNMASLELAVQVTSRLYTFGGLICVLADSTDIANNDTIFR